MAFSLIGFDPATPFFEAAVEHAIRHVIEDVIGKQIDLTIRPGSHSVVLDMPCLECDFIEIASTRSGENKKRIVSVDRCFVVPKKKKTVSPFHWFTGENCDRFRLSLY